MCNFNKQNEDTKALIHLFMTKAAESVGGTNFLLELIEAIKSKKPSGLSEKNSQVASNHTIIKWNKVVFKDKVDLIRTILDNNRSSENPNLNILNEENTKKRKNILNMVRALTPLEFIVTPQNPKDGAGFNFKVFDATSETEVKFNPIFISIFFCSTEFIKKALKHHID
ncbi:hypothetical protein JHD47_06170 [Sulfurimonas sp. SAG-AH-194-L11]|nr:hypothetical protein [Sulfurimonas sp. SAG-AH-194-L11]MDF1877399.1 hypothetical protein [Sulfurimonas sp. SAG-AH-194-L11]